MLENLYKIFGDTLPERHVFFATQGAPTRAILFKEFGSWVGFVNDYVRFVAKNKAVEEDVSKVATATKETKSA